MIETNLIEDLRRLSPPSHGGWLGIALLVLVVGGMAWWLRGRGRVKSGPSTAGATPSSPWDAALAALERLSPLLQPERSREYGIESTGILRRYVEARYALHAPLLTTEEFLVAAAASPQLPADDRGPLARFLELCDLFKFGRFIASADELQQLHTAALNFVLRSRPSPGPPAGEAQP